MNPADLLREAGRQFTRFLPLYALYATVHILLAAAFYSLDMLVVATFHGDAPPDLWIQALSLIKQGVMVTAIAALQALIFARIGKDLDKPLWKCRSDQEALARFFTPWLILNLLVVLIESLGRIPVVRHSSDGQVLLAFLYLLSSLLYLPIGACIMHAGALRWEALGTSLRPLVRFPRLSLLVLLLQCAQFIVYIAVAGLLAPLETGPVHGLLYALSYLPLTALELLAFIAMWRICMNHRDTAFEDHSSDFPY